jgi:hypothetical protein
MRQVPAVLDDHQARVWQGAVQTPAHPERDELVLAAPHEECRYFQRFILCCELAEVRRNDPLGRLEHGVAAAVALQGLGVGLDRRLSNLAVVVICEFQDMPGQELARQQGQP